MESLNGIINKTEEEIKSEGTQVVDNEAKIEDNLPNEEGDDGWIDIIGSGGLKKKVLKEGVCESRPAKGDTVNIIAKGRLENGTEVDDLNDFIFTVGDGEAINGLDLLVTLMDKDEESEVYMEARFAYGDKGLEPNIPPNANLFYTVKLVDFTPEKEPENLTIEERLIVGIRKRERGNWWFKRDENQQAIMCYKAAVDFLDDTSDTYGEETCLEVKEIIDERLKTLNNMAAAQIKIEAYDIALKTLDAVLQCQPNNVKALYRKGKVLGIQGEAKEGLEVLMKALKIDPDSQILHLEAAKLREKTRQEMESEKSLYRKMLGIKPGTKKKEKERYPTLRGVPVKMWATIFIVLLSVMMAFKHRESILGTW